MLGEALPPLTLVLRDAFGNAITAPPQDLPPVCAEVYAAPGTSQCAPMPDVQAAVTQVRQTGLALWMTGMLDDSAGIICAC